MNDIDDLSLETMLSQLEKMQEQIDNLKKEKKANEETISKHDSEMQTLLSKLDEQRLVIQNLTVENTKMKFDLQELVTNKNDERESNANRRYELNSQIDQLKNKNENLIQENRQKEKEVGDVKRNIARKNEAIKAQRSELNSKENTITLWRILFTVMGIFAFWMYVIAAHTMGWWAPASEIFSWLLGIGFVGIVLFGLFNIAHDNPMCTMWGLGSCGFLSLIVWLIFR